MTDTHNPPSTADTDPQPTPPVPPTAPAAPVGAPAAPAGAPSAPAAAPSAAPNGAPAAPAAPAATPNYAPPAPPVAPDQSAAPSYAQPAATGFGEAPAYAQTAVAPKGKNGLGLAALIVGAVAFVMALIPVATYVAGFIAFVGLVLGIIALVLKNRVKRIAAIGTIVSGIALVLSIVMSVVYTVALIASVEPDFFSEVNQEITGEAPLAEEPAGEEESPAASDAIGTRTNPAPLGSVVELTGFDGMAYDITLGAPTLNANDAVAAANQFNEAPPAGFQYAMVPVTFTYTGDTTGTPWIDVSIEFVSAAGTTHTKSDVSVVAPSPAVTDINDLYPGASGTGNVVILVPSADVEQGTWALSDSFGDETFFFAAQ
ncbi:DUF4190 domain-containing protein [Salinibacterium sp. ZJ454]|uniref:DUF4190 domain-containing protein n=1 Tax=Salinibacterium sp. ZJ454 TaxID=2708339 RepID=UPI001422C4A2|nr:DUF4190 domain-containing protein [Salinibacterium sp. ZJ454]